MEQTGTSSRPEIKEPLGETRPKCTPAKEPELEVVQLTGHMRRIKCRVIPKWDRVTLKWEGNIHKWAEEIALPQRDSRKARKSQANAETAGSPLKAPLQTTTVTRRKVAGMEVAA